MIVPVETNTGTKTLIDSLNESVPAIPLLTSPGGAQGQERRSPSPIESAERSLQLRSGPSGGCRLNGSRPTALYSQAGFFSGYPTNALSFK